MPGINFLDNQKHDDDQKPKDKDDKKAKPAWSEPKKEDKAPKSSAFSFLPFISKKEPADKSAASAIDKNKIKASREEILNLIKHHEDSKPQPQKKSDNFLAALAEKLKKQPGPKEVLIDYQRVFNQEKEHKNQIGKIFNIKPAVENKPALAPVKKFKNDWFKGLREWFNNKLTALSEHKNQAPKIIKLPKAEEIKPVPAMPPPIIKQEAKPIEAKAEVKEIPKEAKIEEKKPNQPSEPRQRVIETNLMQGELVTFFDWRSKVMILVGAVLGPVLLIGAVYYGLVFYQKSNEAKNLAQAQKFAELEQNIAKEEAGAKEISGFEAQLKTVSKIFGQHIYWTNFFKFLEDNTIKDVYFINFDGDTSGNYLMDALAVNYGGIAGQVNAFKNDKKITAVEAEGGETVSGDKASQSLIKFILNFTVAKSIFTE